MMNFGSLANTKPANTTSYLKPYEIHSDVVIKGSEIKEGTSANGNAWKSLNITFGNDNGIYSHSIFWITSEKDFERGTTQMSNGGTRELPSNWERTRDVMAAIGFAYFPEHFKKLQAASAKAKSFDEIALNFKKMVDANAGKNPTNMKLVGRESNGRVYASLPNCTGIAQAKDEKRAAENNVNVGDWYTWMVTPFGDNLSFTNYEISKANEYKNAKPTPMKEESETTSFDTAESDDVNFDELLGGL